MNIILRLIFELTDSMHVFSYNNYIPKLGYLKDSNAAAHSVDTGIR